MYTFLKTCALALALAGLVPAQAADRRTADEAQALVKKAVKYLKENGKEKAFPAFSNPKGDFVDRELYLFVTDLNGKVLAHGSTPRMIGKDLIEIKDVDGKPFMKEQIELAKTKGSGWVELKMNNPVTNRIEQKASYVERVDDVMIGCGFYK